MTDGTDISVVECKACGFLDISFRVDRVITVAENHMDENPSHQLYLHTFESDTSQKL